MKTCINLKQKFMNQQNVNKPILINSEKKELMI